MEDEEETVDSGGSNDSTESYAIENELSDKELVLTEDELRDEESELTEDELRNFIEEELSDLSEDELIDLTEAKIRWLMHTKRERRLIKQLKATRKINWSRLLYRKFLIEQRRKREIIKGRHLEETAKEDQTDEEKAKNLEVGLESIDSMTEWPLRPRDVQLEGYGVHQDFSSRHTQDPTRNCTPKRAFIDLSGLRPNAVPDQQPGTSDSESEQSLLDDNDEPDTRPSAQIEEVFLAYLMKISKEKFCNRTDAAQLRADGFDTSADDELMTTQLRPLARNMIAGLNALLRGMDDQAVGREEGWFDHNNWETVMMMASQQGWPKEILQRATARCSAIFKESARPEKTRITINEEKQEESAEFKPGKKQLLCPVKNCIRHRIPFALMRSLGEHMDKSHAREST